MSFLEGFDSITGQPMHDRQNNILVVFFSWDPSNRSKILYFQFLWSFHYVTPFNVNWTALFALNGIHFACVHRICCVKMALSFNNVCLCMYREDIGISFQCGWCKIRNFLVTEQLLSISVLLIARFESFHHLRRRGWNYQ